MQTRPFAGWNLSQLMLGTVQFGLNYGIANHAGQPSLETARDIIACAHEGGVNCLDTAAIYGQSEEILGQALEDLGLQNEMIVVSKVAHLADDLAPSKAAALIEESILSSLQLLRLERLPICLFHSETGFPYLDALKKLQSKGLVGQIGVSMSGLDIEAGTRVVADERVAAMQLPMNALDARFQKCGVLDAAKNRGAAVFARSVFLQGLLLMSDDDVPEELAEVLPILGCLRELAMQAGLTMTELCARYVLGLPGVTCVLTGVETLAQMRENIALFEAGALPEDLQKAVQSATPTLPEKILTPRLWSMRMPDAARATARTAGTAPLRTTMTSGGLEARACACCRAARHADRCDACETVGMITLTAGAGSRGRSGAMLGHATIRGARGTARCLRCHATSCSSSWPSSPVRRGRSRGWCRRCRPAASRAGRRAATS